MRPWDAYILEQVRDASLVPSIVRDAVRHLRHLRHQQANRERQHTRPLPSSAREYRPYKPILSPPVLEQLSVLIAIRPVLQYLPSIGSEMERRRLLYRAFARGAARYWLPRNASWASTFYTHVVRDYPSEVAATLDVVLGPNGSDGSQIRRQAGRLHAVLQHELPMLQWTQGPRHEWRYESIRNPQAAPERLLESDFKDALRIAVPWGTRCMAGGSLDWAEYKRLFRGRDLEHKHFFSDPECFKHAIPLLDRHTDCGSLLIPTFHVDDVGAPGGSPMRRPKLTSVDPVGGVNAGGDELEGFVPDRLVLLADWEPLADVPFPPTGEPFSVEVPDWATAVQVSGYAGDREELLATYLVPWSGSVDFRVGGETFSVQCAKYDDDFGEARVIRLVPAHSRASVVDAQDATEGQDRAARVLRYEPPHTLSDDDLRAFLQGAAATSAVREHTGAPGRASVFGWRSRRLQSALVAAIVFSAFFLVILITRSTTAPLLHEEPLTHNSQQQPVTAAAIAPNGKYLVYADSDGMTILDVASTRATRLPLQLSAVTAFAWSPDGSTLLVTGHDNHTGQSGLWQIQALTGVARKLRDGVSRAAVSPDGRTIAFIDDSGKQVSVMRADGAECHALFSGVAGDSFRQIMWSPDGKRLVLGRLHLGAATLQITLEALDERGAITTILKSDPGLRSAVITPAGRLIYAATDARDTTLWQCDTIDWIGGPPCKPRRITTLLGTDVTDLSVTADGSRVALLRGPYKADVYVAELRSPGVLLGQAQRLTQDDGDNLVTAWTADSAEVLFHSNRRGHWEIYKQRLGEREAERVVSGPSARGARPSPDGKSFYYSERPRSGNWEWPRPLKLMRVSLGGGVPETVFTELWRVSSIRCARSPSRVCVLGKLGNKELSLNQLSEDGRKTPLPSIAIDPQADQTHWDLSPDGKQIAILNGEVGGAGRIRTRALDGGPTREIAVTGRSGLQSLDWSSDGRGWYISSASAWGAVILYVDELGQARIVRDQPRSFGTWAIPSPDGKWLAILEWSAALNVWMVDLS